MILHFKDLDTWKVNHQVVLLIYKITSSFPKEEKYGLVDQLRRAAVSITSNIAEGWGMFHFANKIRHYYIARGSSCEVQNLLIVAYELKIITDKEYDRISLMVFDGFKVLNGLIRSVEKNKP